MSIGFKLISFGEGYSPFGGRAGNFGKDYLTPYFYKTKRLLF